MSSPKDDSELSVLEIQLRQLARENAALKQIEQSKAYRFANRLRGGSYLRAFELGVRLFAERFGIGVEEGGRKALARTAKARWRLRQIAGRLSNGDELLALERTPAPEGRVRVLVMGAGGLGDALGTMVVAAALERMLSPCEIYLAHASSAARELANPYVTGAWTIEPADYARLQNNLALLDVFDLIVDHHYCVRYIETPSERIEARLPAGYLLSAASALRPFAGMLSCHPLQNNLLGREAARAGLSALDVAGATGALNIDGDSAIPLFLTAESYSVFDTLSALRVQSYVTIHNGVDNREARAGGPRPTKLLPSETWAQVVAELKRANLVVVQLGQVEDDLVEGVDHDLRGRTSLLEAAAVLKQAACHVDTEGGLVHLARAVYCRSVVAFGPTPIAFFGYRQNVNLPPPRCGDCWWTTTDWLQRCPRGTVGPECMTAHSARQIAEQALSLVAARREPAFEIQSSDVMASSDGPAALGLRQIESARLDPSRASIACIGTRTALDAALMTVASRVDTFDIDHRGGREQKGGEPMRSGYTRCGSIYNLPADSEAYAVVMCTGALDGITSREYALRELLRIVRPGGVLSLTFGLSSSRPQRGVSTTTGNLDVASLDALLRELGLEPGPFDDVRARAGAQEMNKATCGVGPHATIGGLVIRRTK